MAGFQVDTTGGRPDGIGIECRLFSLALVNAADEDPLADEHAKSTVALPALVLARREGGNEGVGRAYDALDP